MDMTARRTFHMINESLDTAEKATGETEAFMSGRRSKALLEKDRGVESSSPGCGGLESGKRSRP